MRKLLVVAAMLAMGAAHAERSPAEGQKLAQEAVKVLKTLDPQVLKGEGMAGAPFVQFTRDFQRPLYESSNKWPVMGDKEATTWGDYLYCRDALLDLQTLGMGQQNGSLKGESLKRKVAGYKRIKGKCEAASRLTPDKL